MVEVKEKLLEQYLDEHRAKVTKNLIRIIGIYLIISILWNALFMLFELPFSRASLPLLAFSLCLLSVVTIVSRFVCIPSKLMQFIMLSYLAVLIVCLYFGSGYTESWSYFLLLPLLTGIYGEKKTLFYYSIVGMILLAVMSLYFPKSTYIVDTIDISNRILFYVILATFSFLLLQTFHLIYSKQVGTVVRSMEETIEQVVNSFIVSVEAKDLYTFGHSERVSKYAVALAKFLPEYKNKDKQKRLRLSGLLHDIGKINIPEQILTKPGRLTAEEFEVIKTHTVVGARMVEKIEGLQSLKSGVLFHHEKWDGTGYPTRKKGTDIPLEARILAIADAFDAMTTNRSYRSEMSLEEAFRRLEEGKGTHFDPHLIEVLQNAKFEFKKIYKESQHPTKEFETLTDWL
ncbi:HD-GYP domain-containing protein [Bacillus timonensis]|nr:HD-GYP domain-containing protein [Bacillus timonensis]